MFKQFKRRQLTINLTVFSIFLLVVFAFLYLSTYREIQTRNDFTLDMALKEQTVDDPIGDQRLLGPGNNYFFVITMVDGEVANTYAPLFVNETMVADSIEQIDGDSGRVQVQDFVLQYDSVQLGDVTKIAFVDITKDVDILTSQLLTYGIVFVVAIGIVFVIMNYLTNLSIKPIKENYEKQRDFVANASHELKTPLTVINANLDVLSSVNDDESKWINYIKSETLRMNKLIQDLLLLAKSSSDQAIVKTEFDASNVIESLLLGVDALAFEKKITLESNLEEEVLVKFNETQFSQLVMILIDNALKYTPIQEKVIIDLKSTSKGSELSVTNTGIGLTKEESSSIYDRFYMGEKSRNNETNSFGLGLSIAREIVRVNKAKILVDSQPGEYTKFVVKF